MTDPPTASLTGNRFYGLRHARSEANEQGIIVSDPAVGCDDFGLSSAGRETFGVSLPNLADSVGPNPRVIASDFQRTRETAELLLGQLSDEAILQLDERLRERFFGELEAESSIHYADIWREDAINPEHTLWNVESVVSVANRMQDVVRTLNESADAQTFVLVSHGDPLQILETLLSGEPLSTHRQRAPLGPGELRRLL